MSAVSLPSLQFEFYISKSDFPETRSLLKQKLFRYGIFMNLDDKILIEDAEGDRVVIDDENITKYINIKKLSSNIKVILMKIETKEKHDGDDYKIDLLNSSATDMLFNMSINDLYYKKYSDFNMDSEHLVINESIILNRQDCCYQAVFKKYLNDVNSIINSQGGDLASYLQTETFYEFKEQYSFDEIKAARDLVIPFHNILMFVNEKGEHRFKEVKNSLALLHEKYKQNEISYYELENKLKYYISLFEKNQAIFNKFMLELNQHIYDFDFDFSGKNFNPSGFENNLCNVFSFIIKTIHYFNSIDTEFPVKLKTEKYKKVETKCIHSIKGGNTFCLCEIRFLNPDYWKNTIYNRAVYEDLLKMEKLYEV
jgi:hypothetical protein